MLIAESTGGTRRSPVEEFISRENVRRFKAQLVAATDEGQRVEIEVLLIAERQHLHELRRSKVSPKT
jgi:hypothetical protein